MDEWDYGIAAWQDAYFCRINWCLLLHTVVLLWPGIRNLIMINGTSFAFKTRFYEFKVKLSDNGVS